jgi:transcriptional regulator with GAF, ATPase, and Fis domain
VTEAPEERERMADPLADLDEADELRADESGTAEQESGDPLRRTAADWSSERAFESLSRVARTITSNLDSRSLVEEILDVAITAVRARRGIIFLGSGTDSPLVPAVARSLSGQDLADLERVSRTILLRGSRGEPIASGDAVHDPRFVDVPSIQVHQIHSVACVPMIARGRPVGVIYADHPEAGAFPRHVEMFLEAFAGIAAVAIENARLHDDLRSENVRMRQQLTSLDAFGRIITVSPLMMETLHRAAVVARVDTPVMLLGESGTGKELLARAIHDASPRALNPFLAYNCAAVPRDLMESIFFGHVRGAFSGAVRDVPGLFRQADRGVLLLDEIAELDPALQAKLLRVIEDGMIRPVGGEREIPVDVRVLTATSRDLSEAVRRREFREDLFYRLNVLELRVPPLRDRPEDIPVLVEHFLRKHSDPQAPRLVFGADAIEVLQSLGWPGNVRQLENLVRRVLVLSSEPVVSADGIQRWLGTGSAEPDAAEPRASSAAPARTQTLDEQEREAIRRALEEADGNKTLAARQLGIHRNSLVRRMRRLKIRDDS